MKSINFLSYLSIERNIIKNMGQCGGDYLKALYKKCFLNYGKEIDTSKENSFLRLIEKAKNDWQFSNRLLAEATDPDLIDYVIYLVKSNEAKYRYLIKLAREEKIKCDLWQEQKINDM